MGSGDTYPTLASALSKGQAHLCLETAEAELGDIMSRLPLAAGRTLATKIVCICIFITCHYEILIMQRNEVFHHTLLQLEKLRL